MTKQDLKNGMILEDRIGDKYLLCEGVMRGLSGYTLIYHYSDDLTVKDWSKRDIVKVYKDTGMYNLESMFKEDNLKLLWERKELKLTVLELEVLKALDTLGFVYIARDKGGNIFAYQHKPVKDLEIWFFNNTVHYDEMYPIKLTRELFTFVDWKDKEPTSISNLLSKIFNGGNEMNKSTIINSDLNSITNLHNEQFSNLYKDFAKIKELENNK